MSNKQKWLKYCSERYPGGNEEILSFIYKITSHYDNDDEVECDSIAIANLFSGGYCYYFAKMLEDAFEGKAMWLYKRNHILFMDLNGICYDSWGVFDASI